MSRRKKKGGHGGGGGGGHDGSGGMRWLLTYADVVTLLLALFVYLFSVSTVNVGKFRQFGEAFAEFFDFGARESIAEKKEEGGAGKGSGAGGNIPMSGARIKKEGKSYGALDSGFTGSQDERKRIENLRVMLMTKLRPFLDMENAEIIEKKGDVVLQLRDSALFNRGSAEIRKEMKTPLLMISEQIRGLTNEIRIEGHTDNTPTQGARFKSNWHLSSARASSIVDFFATEGGIDPARLSATGYAEYKPLVLNYPNLGNPLNRRVEIVIVAHKSEEYYFSE